MGVDGSEDRLRQRGTAAKEGGGPTLTRDSLSEYPVFRLSTFALSEIDNGGALHSALVRRRRNCVLVGPSKPVYKM